MSIPLMLLGMSGLGMMSVGAIWIFKLAFQRSESWGLACLFIPLAMFVFAARFWRVAWLPGVLLLVGVLLFGGTMSQTP